MHRSTARIVHAASLILAVLPAPGIPKGEEGLSPEGVPVATKPILGDLEWVVSGTVALDVLDRADADGKARQGDLRRARIGGAVLWRQAWAFSLGGDLAHSGALGQASLAYYALPVTFELGRFPEPFGLVQQEVSAGQAFMELPMFAALTPAYGLGLAITIAEPRHSFSLGAFAPTSVGDRIQRRQPEESVTLRATGVPLRTEGVLVHLGSSFSFRRPVDDVLRFAAIPETVLLPELFIESAPLVSERYTVWGAEVAFLGGPLMVQAEGVLARLPGVEGTQVSFSGGHVETALALGAERRGYRASRGIVGPLYSRRPLGTGGLGALELAARYSTLALTSHQLGDFVAEQQGPELRDAYSGEKGEVLSLGVNWHITDDMKLTFERLDVESHARSSMESATVYQGRVQLQFSRP